MCVHTEEDARDTGERLADSLLSFVYMSSSISGVGLEAARREIELSYSDGHATRKKLLGILDTLAETIGVAVGV